MSFAGFAGVTNTDATNASQGAGAGAPASDLTAHTGDDHAPSTNQPQPPKRNGSDSEKSSDYPSEKQESTYDPKRQSADDAGLVGDTVTYEEEEKKREAEVLGLARAITSHSSYHESGDVFGAGTDSKLNPHSPNFNARSWVKAVLKLFAEDPKAAPSRTAGIAFRNLNVYGFGDATDYQKTVSNIVLKAVGAVRGLLGHGQQRIDILQNFEGCVHAGEMLVVLGPPGSGCSTLLKTISGETHGFNIAENSYLNYQGISPEQMHKDFRGEAIYTAEVDVHFPQMSVGDTLTFAARARAPRHVPGGQSKKVFANHLRDVVMAIFGISHTVNTNVGNEYVRGVSGGERKRVTIAEAALSGAPLQCWDNSTRGLDSANAVEFCRTLRMSTELSGTTACVAIYQAPQAAYDLFDKAIVLYEGREIYFGRADKARQYFEELGFDCPDRQTTADFCTSMTSPAERVIRKGFEQRVPRTSDDFARCWKESSTRQALMEEIEAYDQKYAIGGEYLEKFKESRRATQARRQRIKSPYTLSYVQQVELCLWRGFRRLIGDPSLTLTQLFGNFIMALIVGSVFYNLQLDTNSFFARGALIFFAVLLNAFGSALEILTLYAQRPIVEKHARYAFYHPSAEAFASMLTDLPYKVLNSIIFNLTVYFLTNLRRTPGAFFFFLLITFFLTLVMSMVFRTIASTSRTLSQAMAPAAIIILSIVAFTGFAIPVTYMHGWCRWINYLDPVAYGFESLMINEFEDQLYACSQFVPSGPGYNNVAPDQRICGTTGSAPGANYVNGNDFLGSSYAYYPQHKWRNFGIMIAFLFGFMFFYLIAAEFISAKKSKGEVLVFPRGHIPAALKDNTSDDEESSRDRPAGLEKVTTGASHAKNIIQRQTAIFSWRDVCLDIKIKGEPRRILDKVDGWVKPGTLTALMGVSGAGKTSLLDALATRTTMGVITGDMLVDGRQRDASFQRKTGYVQQQDLHLSTSTVREALVFSALLRQPAKTPRAEKIAYAEEVIKLLDMQEYADAVVGVPGEGLNVEQRKRLTIGVELAAKPELLLFLDEPTSGLDSQTSWAICDLMEKLTDSGQAILCTIHQPSAMLFERFDRLLFMQKGGQTVYFGEIGQGASTLIKYFERNGAPKCPQDANPAEWMLEAVGAAPGSHTEVDWYTTWRESPEYTGVHEELDRLKAAGSEEAEVSADKASYKEFAAPFAVQMFEVQKRVFQQYWRTPSYIYSKLALCLSSSLYIGFIFYNSPNSQQGLQDSMFSFFLLLTIFGQLVQQIMPHFVTQRSLYEVRERPSKTYSWKAFMLSNILVELPYQTIMGIIIFVCWYYPVGMYRNAQETDALNSRGILMFLLIWWFMLFTSTFTHMVIAAIETAETGGNIANLMFSLSLIFCGVLATKDALPGFWVFMYYVSPFTWLVSAVLSTGLANSTVQCADNEFLHFNPPAGQTCGTYLNNYQMAYGGTIQNPAATTDCSFCQISSTNTFLSAIGVSFDDRWRNFGILWAYLVFNVFAALALYWWVRMPKGAKKGDGSGEKKHKHKDEKSEEKTMEKTDSSSS